MGLDKMFWFVAKWWQKAEEDKDAKVSALEIKLLPMNTAVLLWASGKNTILLYPVTLNLASIILKILQHS